MTIKHTLDNGLKIIIDEMPHMHSASIGIWVSVGGRFESIELAGMSHFVEHIVFKGTEKRTCQQIKEEIEGIGGDLNAFTCKEFTCFYAKVLGPDCELALDVLADMVMNPALNEKDITHEKEVIIEEIKMYKDSPSQDVHDNFDGVMWPNHAMGRCLTGPEENVKRFTKEDIQNYQNLFYTPNNIVIAAAGAVDAQQLIKKAEQMFGHLSAKDVPAYSPWTSINNSEPRIDWLEKTTEQAHLVLGLPVFHRQDTRRYILSVLNIILGGNMSSRLFNSLREERGLAYDVRSSAYRYMDTGILEISVGLEPQNVYAAVELICEELRGLMNEDVGADELSRAKKYYQGSLKLALEKTSDRMHWIGEDIVFASDVRDLDEILAHIEAVTIEDVRKLAQEIFGQALHMAVISPLKQTPLIENLLVSLIPRS